MQQPRWRQPDVLALAAAAVDIGILGASLTHVQYIPVSPSAGQLPAAAVQ